MEIVLKYFSDFTAEQLRQLKLLEPLYKEWNEKINVISRKDIDSLYEKHVLHSLAIAATFDLSDDMEILDLGTGGGFPGIPLAIFFPEVQFLLADSIGKKLKVVEAVAEGAGIKNISTRHCRAEDIKDKKFDFVVSRAVAPLKDLWRWSKPLLKKRNPTLRPETGDRRPGPSTDPKLPTHDSQLTTAPGLICLKGGNLGAEIQESGTRPRVIEIAELFPEEFFKEKFLLYVNR
ncbi:MAG: 16S rRNA (guanine(527)-N(7))-methyltransferase RsmG [Chitinophagaceae bacterium]